MKTVGASVDQFTANYASIQVCSIPRILPVYASTTSPPGPHVGAFVEDSRHSHGLPPSEEQQQCTVSTSHFPDTSADTLPIITTRRHTSDSTKSVAQTAPTHNTSMVEAIHKSLSTVISDPIHGLSSAVEDSGAVARITRSRRTVTSSEDIVSSSSADGASGREVRPKIVKLKYRTALYARIEQQDTPRQSIAGQSRQQAEVIDLTATTPPATPTPPRQQALRLPMSHTSTGQLPEIPYPGSEHESPISVSQSQSLSTTARGVKRSWQESDDEEEPLEHVGGLGIWDRLKIKEPSRAVCKIFPASWDNARKRQWCRELASRKGTNWQRIFEKAESTPFMTMCVKGVCDGGGGRGCEIIDGACRLHVGESKRYLVQGICFSITKVGGRYVLTDHTKL
jgi:hypothetical protein